VAEETTVSEPEATAAAIGGVVAPADFENALLLSAFLEQTDLDVPGWQRQILEEIVVNGDFARVTLLQEPSMSDLERTVAAVIAFINDRP